MLIKRYLYLLTFCLMFVTQSLFSQIVLQGTVTDNGAEYLGNGAEPVAGALVTVTDQADPGRTFSDYTNGQGEYSIEITQTGVDDDPSVTPSAFLLLQNYPNPFNPSTAIGYVLSKPTHIRIEIYNVLGQKVKTLLDGFESSSGQVIWNGTNDMGQGVPAGLYIYTLKATGKRVSRKMLLIDGHQGSMPTSAAPSYGLDLSSKPVLHKQLSDQYVLTVTGDNIASYEQQNLEITGNLTVDVTVSRTVTDIDGNMYQTVKIGDQWWTVENLKVTHYRNGEAIRLVTGNELWERWFDLSTSAYCAYNNSESNAATYGYLYNWYAATDSRNIAPEGWRVPTDEEWKTLEMYLGMSQSQANAEGERGTDEGGKLKENGTTHWRSPNTGATNESGFSALPGGYRAYDNGYFFNMGYHATFWSATESPTYNAWSRQLAYNSSDISRRGNHKRYGLSVRLVRD